MKEKNNGATVGQILNALQTTGVKITDTRSGANNRVNCRIQIDQAVNHIPDQFVTLDIPEAAATGINNCGQIVGTAYDGWAGTGFITDTTGNYTSIVYDGPVEWEYYGTYAWSINNKGEVHGFYCCDDADVGFVRSTGGSFTKLNSNPNTNDIYGNNDSGDFVGFFWDDEWYLYYGKYVNGTTTFIEDYLPYDINNMGRMAGIGYSGAVITNGSGTIETSFNYASGGYTDAYGINESGHVVGCFWPSGGGGTGFLRTPDGTLTAINSGASETCAMGINDSRQVVGYYVNGSGTWKAFVDLSW